MTLGCMAALETHLNGEQLKTEIKKLNTDSVIGNRFHFLMFDPLKSVSVLEDSNIEYDTSFKFCRTIGFRRGTCFPFYLYNFETDNISPVVEIPLIVMDSSLSNEKYMGLSKEDSPTGRI